jgi:hypothetical protein
MDSTTAIGLTLSAVALAATIRAFTSEHQLYNTVTSQSLHFFSRPHAAIPREEVKHPAAWRGSQLSKQPEKWIHHLDDATVADLRRMVSTLSLESPLLHRISRAQCSRLLSAATLALIDDIREELLHGLGFRLVRNVPVAQWSSEESEIFFWAWGQLLGTPGAQDNDGALLGHVIDIGADAAKDRQYKTNAAIAYHCDAADVVGLLCLSKARHGGSSRIVSSISVFNSILRAKPHLVPHLFRSFPLDTRGSGGISWIPMTPMRAAGAKLRTFFHSEYFRSAAASGAAPSLSRAQKETLDAVDAAAAESDLYLDMELEPGDVQMVNNHFLLHSRTAYVDFEEPSKKRHLLRLWLSLEEPLPLALKALKMWEYLKLLVHLAAAKLQAGTALKGGFGVKHS